MPKEHKCLNCGDGYTEADIRRLRGFNEPFLLLRAKGGKFLCPTCYEEYCQMGLQEQEELIGKATKDKS